MSWKMTLDTLVPDAATWMLDPRTAPAGGIRVSTNRSPSGLKDGRAPVSDNSKSASRLQIFFQVAGGACCRLWKTTRVASGDQAAARIGPLGPLAPLV